MIALLRKFTFLPSPKNPGDVFYNVIERYFFHPVSEISFTMLKIYAFYNTAERYYFTAYIIRDAFTM